MPGWAGCHVHLEQVSCWDQGSRVCSALPSGSPGEMVLPTSPHMLACSARPSPPRTAGSTVGTAALPAASSPKSQGLALDSSRSKVPGPPAEVMAKIAFNTI